MLEEPINELGKTSEVSLRARKLICEHSFTINAVVVNVIFLMIEMLIDGHDELSQCRYKLHLTDAYIIGDDVIFTC